MEQKSCLRVAILISLFAISCGRELKSAHKDNLPVYNHTLAMTLVEYASASNFQVSRPTKHSGLQCLKPGLHVGRQVSGLVDHQDSTLIDQVTVLGFEMIELIVDVEHCLQGFVGVAKNLNAIVIAFRGSASIMNWIEDLYWKQLDLKYPGMPEAMVHHGFYSSYHETTVRPGVLHAVKLAKELYGDINIMVTGHSMGGAMAAFCALDLAVNQKIQNVQVMTFGQPRIGNTAFTSYYSQLVPNTIRVTNYHDMVPHLPPYYPHLTEKTYRHFPREVWLHGNGSSTSSYPVEKVCDGSGEDPNCSRSVAGTSIFDHFTYYEVKIISGTPGSCKIVMDPRVASYSTQDLAGNFVLYRDPSAASVVEVKTETSTPSNFI
ncbi:alpha/beta-Hydrolases superfamily protein [Actinidia rufa]|uniref:Alpha/beta-Hydrolases superfamily protein n=1 Tax=Actinidia rufa TaxID=165716 RepID=A0A7J0HFD1_9ERIC|nr:alpha/beta-Hydrolases superfamily protein [Actinidia rufa]